MKDNSAAELGITPPYKFKPKYGMIGRANRVQCLAKRIAEANTAEGVVAIAREHTSSLTTEDVPAISDAERCIKCLHCATIAKVEVNDDMQIVGANLPTTTAQAADQAQKQPAGCPVGKLMTQQSAGA